MRIATYNVLATCYIKPEYYPEIDPAYLDPGLRRERQIARIRSLDADLICLQEVEQDLWDQLLVRGLEGRFLCKQGRLDGCATLVRVASGALAWREVRLTCAPPQVALVAEWGGMTVINTHLKWAPPGDDLPVRQVEELLELLGDATEILICGDLNFTLEHPAAEAVKARGFQAGGTSPTAFANGQSKRIDHVFYSNRLQVTDLVPALQPPVPSQDEPSDHIPLTVEVAR